MSSSSFKLRKFFESYYFIELDIAVLTLLLLGVFFLIDDNLYLENESLNSFFFASGVSIIITLLLFLSFFAPDFIYPP